MELIWEMFMQSESFTGDVLFQRSFPLKDHATYRTALRLGHAQLSNRGKMSPLFLVFFHEETGWQQLL